MTKIVAPAPSELDFTIVYNQEPIPVSKFKLAVYSPMFRKIPEFLNSSKYEVTGIAPVSIFKAFIEAAQGKKLDITESTVLDFVQLAETWQIDSIHRDCVQFIDANPNLGKITEKLKSQSSAALESIISKNIDAVLEIRSFADFSIESLTRILTHKDRIVKNQHRLHKFVMKMLERYGTRAVPLVAAIDIRLLTADEACDLLEHPALAKDGLNESSACLIRETSAIKKELSMNNTSLEQILKRLDTLESMFTVVTETVEKIDKLSSTVKDTGSSGVDKKLDALDAKIDQTMKNLRDASAQIIAEMENKAQKDLQKTQSTVNSLTQRLTLLEQKCDTMRNESNAIDDTTDKVCDAINQAESACNADRTAIPYRNIESPGILETLAAEARGNVHEHGVVDIRASGSTHAQPWQVADKDWEDFWFSENKPDQWISFNFKKRNVIVTDYKIKTHKYGAGSCHLKAWKLQGSNNGDSWTDLDVRDTEDLNEARKTEHFACSTKAGPFQMIRVLSTGPNNRGDSLMAMTHIDFYGSMN